MKKYHYTECGLDNIYLTDGFTIKKLPNGEKIIQIHNIHKLHTAIGKILVFKNSLLIDKEIKFIRRTLDLSQTALGKLLGVEYQSVLGWEKNKTPISKTADRLLKLIFFSYLNKNSETYNMINKVSSADTDDSQEPQSDINFHEIKHTWEAVA